MSASDPLIRSPPPVPGSAPARQRPCSARPSQGSVVGARPSAFGTAQGTGGELPSGNLTGTAEAVHKKVPTGPGWGQVIGPLAQQNTAVSTACFSQQPIRPSPQSQSFFRGYGSSLPTSLTYIVLSTRGCSPWRPAADIGTAHRESHTHPQDFQGPTAVHRTPREARCFAWPGTLSRGEPIPGISATQQEKRTLAGTTASVSWFNCVTALGPP